MKDEPQIIRTARENQQRTASLFPVRATFITGVGLITAGLLAGSGLALDHRGITGIVRDAGSGAPIAGATIKVWSSRFIDVASATTDGVGRYTIDLNPGAFQVEAVAPYFQKRFHEGDHVRGELATVGEGAPTVVDFALPAAAVLSGTVIRGDGTFLYPGYVWLIYRGNPQLEYYPLPTEKDGTYRSESLPPGLYEVSASTYDPVAKQLISPSWGYPSPVTLVAGRPTQIDMRMEDKTVEPAWVGLATDETGQPLPGVQFRISAVTVGDDGEEGTSHISLRRTNAKGRIELDELEPGRYRVTTAEVPTPYAPWRNPDPKAKGAQVFARDFLIAPGGGHVTTEMQFLRGRTLQVRIRDVLGEPASEEARVALSLWTSGDRSAGGVGFSSLPETLGPGEFAVRGLLPGANYELRLQDRDDAARWCVAQVTGDAKRTIAVPKDADPGPIDIRVRPCLQP